MDDWKVWVDNSTSSTTPAPRKLLLHLINSSSSYEAPVSDLSQNGTSDLLVVKSPRARASFFPLKDYDAQRLVAYRLAMQTICSQQADPFFARYR